MKGSTADVAAVVGRFPADGVRRLEVIYAQFGSGIADGDEPVLGHDFKESFQHLLPRSVLRRIFRLEDVVVRVVPFSPHAYETGFEHGNHVGILPEDRFQLFDMASGDVPWGIPWFVFFRVGITETHDGFHTAVPYHPQITPYLVQVRGGNVLVTEVSHHVNGEDEAHSLIPQLLQLFLCQFVVLVRVELMVCEHTPFGIDDFLVRRCIGNGCHCSFPIVYVR